MTLLLPMAIGPAGPKGDTGAMGPQGAQGPAGQAVPAGSAGLPPGFGGDYFGGAVPDGWLLCDGSAVSRATYAALFAAIGILHGAGDGATTFNLPDSRGRATIGAGQGAGLTARALGAKGGEETHTLTIPEMPAHTHPYTGGKVNVNWGGGNSGSPSDVPLADPLVSGSTGGGSAHNTMQPFLVATKIIKA